jgi:tetratricopeptide (TPR) repeat protein
MSTPEEPKRWENLPTYGLAVVCLLLGAIVGYLAHPKRPTLGNASQVPLAAADGRMPSPEQLKHMVDKTLEPSLIALQKDPNNASLLSNIGVEYARAQQFETAVSYFERAVKAKPTADGYVILARAYYFAGSKEKALAALNHALELDPKSGNALINLGSLKLQVLNDPKGAIEAWQLLIKDYPNFPERAKVEQLIAQAKQQLSSSAGKKTDKPAM